MPTSSLAAVAADLARASDVAAAVERLNGEIASERGVGFALLGFDPRRQALYPQRRGGDPARAERERSYMALDHLPPSVQYALLAGDRFADVGDQAQQYARLLGLADAAPDIRLHMKGIVLDGALASVLALHDGRRRAGGKLLERVQNLALLFELAFARLYEREARFEAVAALHDVTSRLRAEHTSAVAALEREIARLRQSTAGTEPPIVGELRASATRAAERAAAAELRLTAVEAQVATAVERLDRAHVQLHSQAELIREQAETIRRLELGRGAPAPR